VFPALFTASALKVRLKIFPDLAESGRGFPPEMRVQSGGSLIQAAQGEGDSGLIFQAID